MLIGLRFECVGCRPKVALYLAEESHRKGVRAVQELAGEGRDGNVRFQAYSARGRSDSARGVSAQAPRRAEPLLGLLGEMAAGGAGARGADHGRVEGRHFEGEMKKGVEAPGNEGH